MPSRKILLPLLWLFIGINALSVIFRSGLENKGFDTNVLILGNLFLFALTLLSFYLLRKGLITTSTQVFLRLVYSSFLLKLIGGAAVAFLYVYLAGDQLNKPALLTCLFLYLIYSFLEIRILMKITKSKRDA